MKKILYIIIFIISFVCASCSCKKTTRAISVKDSIVSIWGFDKDIELPLDSFLQIKDSFIYDKEIDTWETKERYKWNYGYPDTIKVAFTRNGILEDSVEAVRRGGVKDNTGKTYSPAYVFYSMVGDSWVYDINGKFIEFNESSYPHSGQGHTYQP